MSINMAFTYPKELEKAKEKIEALTDEFIKLMK